MSPSLLNSQSQTYFSQTLLGHLEVAWSLTQMFHSFQTLGFSIPQQTRQLGFHIPIQGSQSQLKAFSPGAEPG